MILGLRKAQSSSVLLRAFLAPMPFFRRPSAIAIPQVDNSSSSLLQLIPLVHQHPTAIPVILPSSFSCFRFFKCGRYPKCSQRFATKKKKDKHDASEICVPLAERKNKRKKAGVDSDSEKEEMEDVDLDDQVTQDSDAEKKEMEDVDLDDQVTQDKKMDMVGLPEQVNHNCFMNHSLFHKALKGAFEFFCNKGVAGSSGAELQTTFCDNILTKVGSEKLSDEATVETLEKESPSIHLTVTVLTTGFWPSYKSFDLNLPADMVKCVEVFIEFYNINGQFDQKTIEFIATTYQIPLPPVDEKNVIEDFEQLVMECVEQLSRMFKADFKVLKKRIEDLITWDYLEREKDMVLGTKEMVPSLVTMEI